MVPLQHKALTGDWRQDARDAYSDFLRPYEFQWFCTFTFKDSIHPEAADKSFRVWLNILNRQLFGQRWGKRAPGGVMWCRALEYQKRGVIHYHALVSGIPSMGRAHLIGLASQYQAVWLHDMGCGFARIDVIRDSQMAVRNYVTKYVAKGGELDFSRNFCEATQHQNPEHDLASRGSGHA